MVTLDTIDKTHVEGTSDEVCSYCGGDVVLANGWRHATTGERVGPAFSPGDLLSAGHNQAGTRVNAVDVMDRTEYDSLPG